jgi:hypothetical protein
LNFTTFEFLAGEREFELSKEKVIVSAPEGQELDTLSPGGAEDL